MDVRILVELASITDVSPQLLRYPTLHRFHQHLVSRPAWNPFRGKEGEREGGEIVRPLHTTTFVHPVGVGPTHLNRRTRKHSVFQGAFFARDILNFNYLQMAPFRAGIAPPPPPGWIVGPRPALECFLFLCLSFVLSIFPSF